MAHDSLSKSRNNPYVGRELPASVRATFLRGTQTFAAEAQVQ
jgi:dihydroorotase-like cyclic amidohydrolase